MPYTQPTLAQFATALASRLNDPANVRWPAAELYTYITEALRWWSAQTSHWRDQSTFTTTVAEPFYDLPTEIPTLRGYNVTNWQLVADLQYALLEPAAPGGTWTGTDQFTLDQLTTAIQRRRDQFLRETGCVVTRSVSAAPFTPTAGRVDLDESILIVRRAAWRVDSTQLLLPLTRTDEWAANAFAPTWPSSASRPRAYSTTDTPPLQLQIIDPPAANGTLDLLSINNGSPLAPGAQTTLDIPDDWAWVVKYGALADLLNGDGLALDSQRAQYCEQRWQQGLLACRETPVVLSARISDVPCTIGAISDADAFSPTWQLVNGVPRRLLLTGQNLVALWPPPGAVGGPYTITLDLVENAPIPTAPISVIQISQDVYDTLLDYSQHIALLKEGPGQLQMSMQLYERAARAAGVDLALQQAQQPSRSPLVKQQVQDVIGPVPDQLAAVP